MSKFSGLALAVDKPQRMALLHPVTRQPLRDADGNEAYIDLWSGDSEVARKQERAITTRRLAVRGRTKITAGEIEADAVDMLVALTAGWRLLDLDGRPIDVPYTSQNARELYQEPALAWLRAQVDEFCGDRANFSPASSTT